MYSNVFFLLYVAVWLSNISNSMLSSTELLKVILPGDYYLGKFVKQ